jgi:hypothetical protein
MLAVVLLQIFLSLAAVQPRFVDSKYVEYYDEYYDDYYYDGGDSGESETEYEDTSPAPSPQTTPSDYGGPQPAPQPAPVDYGGVDLQQNIPPQSMDYNTQAVIPGNDLKTR